jgi:hypothetical protein
MKWKNSSGARASSTPSRSRFLVERYQRTATVSELSPRAIENRWNISLAAAFDYPDIRQPVKHELHCDRGE